MRIVGILCVAAVAIASPAQAKRTAIDVPAGRAGDSAESIARQTGTSIVIADPKVAERRVPAIRGHYSTAEAVKRLARAAGAKAVPVGTVGWRLVAAAPPRPRPETRKARNRLPPARAAPEASEPIEIVVAGSKRDVPLKEYPGQVRILDGEALTLGGVGGTEKITQRVPTVSSTFLGSGRNKLFIRGIADSSFTGPTQSTVGQYLGDLRLSYNAPDPDLRLSDLDRVEVLEGPQGTLYGAGSLGGILRLVPNVPELGVTAGAAMIGGSATQHGALGADGSAMLNLPLSGDVAALRIAIDAETQGGYIDKPLLGRDDVNRVNILGGRAIARLDAGEGWTVDLIGIGQVTDGHDSQYADREGPSLTRAAPVSEGFDARYGQGQVVVSGEFGDVRFRSSTGITGQRLEERYDATPPDGSPRLFVQSNDTAMVANETRLWRPLDDRFGWLIGASYTHNRTTLTRTLGAPDAPNATTGVRNMVDEVTLYGEASYRLSQGLIASAGGRVTYSWLGGDGEDIEFAQLTESAKATLAAATAERRESVFLPSASLVATVLEDTTIYLRYQEGFRPGGLAIAGDFVTRFQNDHISTVELGGRTGRAGLDPFSLSANVSFTRWTDIQADYIDGAGLPSTANIGNGQIWSVGVTGNVEIAAGLRLDGGLTYNDSRVDEPSQWLVMSQATQIPNIARFAGRIGFDYLRPLSQDLNLTAQGWAHYVGKSRLGIGPELGEVQGDYLDTGLIVRIGRENMGVTLGITNIADERGNRFALGTPFAIGRDQITPLRPRTVRIGLDANF